MKIEFSIWKFLAVVSLILIFIFLLVRVGGYRLGNIKLPFGIEVGLTPPVTLAVSEPPQNGETAILSAPSAKPPEARNATAQINFPESGATVTRSVYVRGIISELMPSERAFLVVKSVSFGGFYPQGEVLRDPAGNWSLESIYADVGFQYETFVVASSNSASAEMLANEHFRKVGMSVLPEDTFIISPSIVVMRQ